MFMFLILMVVLLCIVQYAFNLFSLNAPVTENGYNEEEMKLVKETRKIWVSVHFTAIFFVQMFGCVKERETLYLSWSSQNDTEVKVTATCIRVPVMRAHAESVNLQFDNPLDEVIIIIIYIVY